MDDNVCLSDVLEMCVRLLATNAADANHKNGDLGDAAEDWRWAGRLGLCPLRCFEKSPEDRGRRFLKKPPVASYSGSRRGRVKPSAPERSNICRVAYLPRASSGKAPFILKHY